MADIILTIIFSIILLIFLYITYFREYLIRRNHQYKCMRCGKCCNLRVRLNKEEIKRIKDAGYRDFLGFFNYMKRINGYCMFLKYNDKIACCTIQDIKPRICNTFPCNVGLFGRRFDDRCQLFNGKLW